MLDPFLILTPLLLLAIVALLGFVGCDKLFDVNPITQLPGIGPSETVVQVGPAGTNELSATLNGLQGGELIVVTVQWKISVAGPQMPAFTPNIFAPVADAYNWQGMNIQVFSAFNPVGNAQLTVTVKLVQNSTVTWNLCLSAYGNVDPNTPTYSPLTSPLNYVGSNPQTSPINLGGTGGDVLYAVGFAADSNGTFPGANNVLSPATGFTAAFLAVTNPLVEQISGFEPIAAQVTNANPDPNAKGFIFAMGIKVAPSS